jgi:hypothetical protein
VEEARNPEKTRQQKEAIERAKKEFESLKRDFNSVFASDGGVRVLNYIAKTCGFFGSSIVANPATGEINVQSTLYNDARRTVYLELRKMLRDDIVGQAEAYKPKSMVSGGEIRKDVRNG